MEQLRTQCEELRAYSQKELQQVQDEMARLQQDYSQSLLQAESEKQQVCEVYTLGLKVLLTCFLSISMSI